MMLATTTTTTATTATTMRTDSKTNKKPTLRGYRSKQKKALSRRNAVAGLNSERLSNNEYPIGEVVLGIELRTHGAKGALIDTANADFMRPGVEVDLEELKEEAVEEALGRSPWRRTCIYGQGTNTGKWQHSEYDQSSN